jgi:uncharacterized SAM-binding protein YcdF (DUF218 family)
MLSFLKGLSQALLLPHTSFYLLLFLALVLIMLKNKWGKRLLIFTLVLFYLLSITPVSNSLLRLLENRYPSLEAPPEGIKYVVVLGGGTLNRETRLPTTSRLNASSTARLLEGIRLFKQIEDGVLVTSGGSSKNIPIEDLSCYQTKRLAIMLGIEEDKIIQICDSRDTYEEAKDVKGVVENEPFLLVTSAFHMPRSVYLFEKLGMNAIPAPCDFKGQSKYNYSYSPFLPITGHLSNSSLAIKEYIGLLFYRLVK